jgi:hypothetical protein
MTDAGPANALNPSHRASYILSDLLDLLYPPPLSPDIITREDVLTRYRLTGLGVPAITALQQAQRIVRTGKDYCQIGLCEFHIGLIYLYWQHCLAAAQQFAEARRQWLFADEAASVCLTYFAEGQARHLALHYEPAMSCYLKAEQWLPRLRLTPPSANLDEFIQNVTSKLRGSQEILRDRMWPPDEPERKAEPLPEQQPPAELPRDESAAAEPVPSTPETPAHPSPQTKEGAIPLPRLNIVHEQATPEVSPVDFSSLHDVPLPIPPRETAEPTSFVLPIKEYYKWYQVENRDGDFLPFVREGAWILVDTRHYSGRYKPDDLVIIGGNNEELKGNIPLRPYIPPAAFRRIYLSRVQLPEVPFTRDPQSGRVRLIYNTGQITMDNGNVLGMVLGFWVNPFQVGVETG